MHIGLFLYLDYCEFNTEVVMCFAIPNLVTINKYIERRLLEHVAVAFESFSSSCSHRLYHFGSSPPAHFIKNKFLNHTLNPDNFSFLYSPRSMLPLLPSRSTPCHESEKRKLVRDNNKNKKLTK